MKMILKLLPWFFLALFGAEIVAVFMPKNDGELHVREFARLPVLLDGRIQAIAGNEDLHIVHGTQRAYERQEEIHTLLPAHQTTGPYHDRSRRCRYSGGIWGEERAVHGVRHDCGFRTARHQRVGHVEEGGADENQACAACEDGRNDFGSDEHLLTYVIPTTAAHDWDTQELSEHRGQVASRIDEISQDDIKRLPLMLGLRPDTQGLYRWRRT